MVETHGDPEHTRDEAIRFADAHCHLDDPAFEGDRAEVLREAEAVGVERLVIAGYLPDTFARASALRGESVRVGIGLHPWTIDETSDDELERRLADLSARVGDADALGEVGLDAVSAERRGVALERQVAVLRRVLALGRDVGLPIVLHVVRAHARAQALVRDAGPLPPTVVHAFVGSAEVARDWLALGATLSFGSDVLRSARTRTTAARLPSDRLLLESDAPHGVPRGERSTPARVVDVARAIAAESGRPITAIARDSWRNTGRIFFRG